MLRHTRWGRTQKSSLEVLDYISVPSWARTKFPWGLGRWQRPEKAEVGWCHLRPNETLAPNQQSLLGRSLSVLFLKLGSHLTLRKSHLGELCGPLASTSTHCYSSNQVPRWAPESVHPPTEDQAPTTVPHLKPIPQRQPLRLDACHSPGTSFFAQAISFDKDGKDLPLCLPQIPHLFDAKATCSVRPSRPNLAFMP